MSRGDEKFIQITSEKTLYRRLLEEPKHGLEYNINNDFKVIRTRIAFVRFEVFTAVAMKNGVFWDVMPCGSCKNRRFEGT
jgi:hypothetical protein